MRSPGVLVATLPAVGGLDWRPGGLFNLDLVALTLANMTFPSRLVFILVGMPGVYQAMQWKAIQRHRGWRRPGTSEMNPALNCRGR